MFISWGMYTNVFISLFIAGNEMGDTIRTPTPSPYIHFWSGEGLDEMKK